MVSALRVVVVCTSCIRHPQRTQQPHYPNKSYIFWTCTEKKTYTSLRSRILVSMKRIQVASREYPYSVFVGRCNRISRIRLLGLPFFKDPVPFFLCFWCKTNRKHTVKHNRSVQSAIKYFLPSKNPNAMSTNTLLVPAYLQLAVGLEYHIGDFYR